MQRQYSTQGSINLPKNQSFNPKVQHRSKAKQYNYNNGRPHFNQTDQNYNAISEAPLGQYMHQKELRHQKQHREVIQHSRQANYWPEHSAHTYNHMPKDYDRCYKKGQAAFAYNQFQECPPQKFGEYHPMEKVSQGTFYDLDQLKRTHLPACLTKSTTKPGQNHDSRPDSTPFNTNCYPKISNHFENTQPSLTQLQYQAQDRDELEMGMGSISGKLKFFYDSQDYGFLINNQTGKDVFFHFDDMKDSGMDRESLILGSNKPHMSAGNRMHYLFGSPQLVPVDQQYTLRFTFDVQPYQGKYGLSYKAVNINFHNAIISPQIGFKADNQNQITYFITQNIGQNSQVEGEQFDQITSVIGLRRLNQLIKLESLKLQNDNKGVIHTQDDLTQMRNSTECNSAIFTPYCQGQQITETVTCNKAATFQNYCHQINNQQVFMNAGQQGNLSEPHPLLPKSLSKQINSNICQNNQVQATQKTSQINMESIQEQLCRVLQLDCEEANIPSPSGAREENVKIQTNEGQDNGFNKQTSQYSKPTSSSSSNSDKQDQHHNYYKEIYIPYTQTLFSNVIWK